MTKGSKFKRYLQFFLVVLAGGAIYPLIYLKTNYQETLLEVFNMSLGDLNSIYSILGVVFTIGYFPSGWLADRFSAKKLLAISLFMTGVAGLWFAQVPSHNSVIIIFAIWGIFSVFTFWSSHLKVVKLLSTPEDEGKFFGILDGGRGAVEAILATIAAAIFAFIIGDNSTPDIALKREAIVGVIYMYSIFIIIISILIVFLVNPESSNSSNEKLSNTENKNKEKITFDKVLSVIKNKFVLTQGGVIFMGYIVTWAIYYLGGFLETNIGISAVDVSKVTLIMLWMRPIGGIVGGVLGDKIGKPNILLIALVAASTTLIAISILPASMSVSVFNILLILTALFIYAIRGTYWSLIGECKISDSIVGLAIGIISFIGYLPDMVIPIVNTFLFSQFGPNGGYNAYFIATAISGLCGVILVMLFKAFIKKDSIVSMKNNNLKGNF